MHNHAEHPPQTRPHPVPANPQKAMRRRRCPNPLRPFPRLRPSQSHRRVQSPQERKTTNCTHSSTSPIFTLPLELRLEILSYLDTADAHALTLTCRELSVPAVDVLYKNYANHNPNKGSHLFPRTVCERPDLAEQVTSLDVRWWNTLRNRRRRKHSANLPKSVPIDSMWNSSLSRFAVPKYRIHFIDPGACLESELFVKTVEVLNMIPPCGTVLPGQDQAYVEEFLDGLTDGKEEAHMLLLLGILRNVRQLHFQGEEALSVRRSIRYWPSLLARSRNAPRNLQTFTMKYPTSYPTYHSVESVDITKDIFRIFPNLERPALEGIGINNGRNQEIGPLPHSTKSASFTQCIDRAGLTVAMAGNQSLKSLLIEPQPCRT